ncbi:Serine O-acetyltransferase [Petrocella atlantisensis]|uniref:Serine O-acetyltransferase n=1 Tax=Petrocella atlantisensis TaxID=2173034 RepID=A0A3P7PZI1_9FIRM|nr:transferase [Petrocella atlantisensis]VDN48541.1 Serine O-acetyltransferase [Petrocella atlantisensis]
MNEENQVLFKRYIQKQLLHFFDCKEDISDFFGEALTRTLKCFKATRNKYYHDEKGMPILSQLHSGQYSIFLYYLGNTIYRNGGSHVLATTTYCLNKTLHSVDWYFEIELPEIFGVEHPLASILGRAKYKDGFFFYQGCTVGGNKGHYPTLGKNVILFSNATIIGKSIIGDNVIVSTGSTIKDEIIPSNALVFGQSPNLIVKEKSLSYMQEKISNFWF